MRNHSLPLRPFTETTATVWISLSAFFSLGALFLSLIGQLNRAGCSTLLAVGTFGSAFAYHRLNGGSWLPRGFRLKRFRKPFPLLYLFCALAALIGGAIYQPSNHDGLCYRIPRLLHWLAEGHWHWIGGADTRMDFTAVGFETLMLPPFAAFHTLRFAFLVNAIPFLLMPGLVFSVFTSLGIKKSIATTWMWILPCGSCFAVQAGSIGNDFLSCTYLLTALIFASSALCSGRASAVSLSVLSAALMTGVKATNLPLLLPIAICLTPVFFRFPKTLISATLAGCIGVFVSFVPTAIANTLHTGDWSGEANSVLRIKNPAAGLVGNSLLIGGACLVPAVFPPADRVNTWFNSLTEKTALSWIKNEFVDFKMTNPQLAAEEHSGLGLGVSGTLVLALIVGWRDIRFGRLRCLGGCVFGGFWIAMLFYMMTLGNRGAPRYLAPYYFGIIALPLLALSSADFSRRRWWRWSSLALLLPITIALACNPARPLLPLGTITNILIEKGVASGIAERMRTVYEVYANRHDVYAPVREMLPLDAKSIAFAGTGGESEYSFWLPLGTRKVTDFHGDAEGKMPNPTGYDVIVASAWGTRDRFGISPEELAKRLGWKITGRVEIRAMASQELATWSVLVPNSNTNPAN